MINDVEDPLECSSISITFTQFSFFFFLLLIIFKYPDFKITDYF
jgi:hypothetical protein